MTKFLRKLEKFDLFSIPFNLTYKKEDKYSTLIGGYFSIGYIILSVSFFILLFIPFIQRKNYNFLYYQKNQDSTDKINFNETENDFAYILESKNNNNTALTCNDLLEVKISYIYNENQNNGYRKKNVTNINKYNCTYNNSTKRFEKVPESQYKCIEHPNEIIQNTYNDINFSYYEIIVSLKDSDKDNFTEITDFLSANDCKLDFYFLDYTVDIDNYNKPIIPYQNSVFLHLSPISIVEMNLFFMKQILKDQSNLQFGLNNENIRENIIFSRIEQYSYFKGENRAELNEKFNDTDYRVYAKIFIRADNKELIIKRKYQNLDEFWADNAGIFFDFFTFINFIFGLIYSLTSYHSLSKKIFFFPEKGNFNSFPDNKKLNALLNEISKVDLNTNDNKDLKDNKYSINQINSNTIKKSGNKKSNSYYKPETKENNEDTIDKFDKPGNNQLNNIKNTIKPDKKTFCYYFCNFFCCGLCCRKKCKCKNIYSPNYFRAREILSEKLDVVLYIRNSLLLDIMNKTIIGDEKADIIKFLSIPLVSNINVNEKYNVFKEKKESYKKYGENDFKNFENKVIKLVNEKEKKELDNNFLRYIKQHLEIMKKLI